MANLYQADRIRENFVKWKSSKVRLLWRVFRPLYHVYIASIFAGQQSYALYTVDTYICCEPFSVGGVRVRWSSMVKRSWFRLAQSFVRYWCMSADKEDTGISGLADEYLVLFFLASTGSADTLSLLCKTSLMSARYSARVARNITWKSYR